MWGSWFGTIFAGALALLLVIALAVFGPALLAIVVALIAVGVIAATSFGANRRGAEKDPVVEQPATVSEPSGRQERYAPNTEDYGSPASGGG